MVCMRVEMVCEQCEVRVNKVKNGRTGKELILEHNLQLGSRWTVSNRLGAELFLVGTDDPLPHRGHLKGMFQLWQFRQSCPLLFNLFILIRSLWNFVQASNQCLLRVAHVSALDLLSVVISTVFIPFSGLLSFLIVLTAQMLSVIEFQLTSHRLMITLHHRLTSRHPFSGYTSNILTFYLFSTLQASCQSDSARIHAHAQIHTWDSWLVLYTTVRQVDVHSCPWLLLPGAAHRYMSGHRENRHANHAHPHACFQILPPILQFIHFASACRKILFCSVFKF